MLTPQQIADLRAPANVRGKVGAAVLFLVSVKQETFERVQVLSATLAPGELDVVWYYVGSSNAHGQRVSLHTDRPEWFMDLEGKIEDARRPR